MNRHEKDVMHKAALQAPLSNLTDSIPILDSLAILGKNGEYYSLYTNTLKRDILHGTLLTGTFFP